MVVPDNLIIPESRIIVYKNLRLVIQTEAEK